MEKESHINQLNGNLRESSGNIISNNINLNENLNQNQNQNQNQKTVFWINDPMILFNRNELFDIWPMESMTREQKLNAISRLVIFFTILGGVLFKNFKILLTGIITLGVLVLTYYLLNNKYKSVKDNLRENFSNEVLYRKFKHNFTNPSQQNPIMNVMLPEIQDNPQRLPAAPAYNKAVEKSINESTKDFVKSNFEDSDEIEEKLFEDLGDKFQFEQSMRQFYSTANTRVPNNQAEFARFCYGNMASCKDGDVDKCLIRNTN